MKKRVKLFSVFNAFLVLMFYSNIQASTPENDPVITSYSVLVENSYLDWNAAKFGGKHKGKIKFKDGQLTFTDSALTSATFSMDMNSISCEDIEDEESNKKLINHLKSSDFFDVENHATASFNTTGIVKYGKDTKDGPEIYKLTGDMTIKGVTQSVKLRAKLYIYKGSSISATAKLEIDRSEFDINYGSGSFFDNLCDKIIQDEIELYINLVARKK